MAKDIDGTLLPRNRDTPPTSSRPAASTCAPAGPAPLRWLFNLWPWRTEVVERGKEDWGRQRTIGGVPVGPEQQYVKSYVLYRVTNRYTGSHTLRKDYLT